MKYSLEILSNQKFWLLLIIDIFLSIKISIKKYWYIFIAPFLFVVNLSNYYYMKQPKLYSLSGTFKLGRLTRPSYSSGVLRLGSVDPMRFDAWLNNFGDPQRDVISSLSGKYVMSRGFRSRISQKNITTLTSINASRVSAFFSINGEGTDRVALIEKGEDFANHISTMFEMKKKEILDPLVNPGFYSNYYRALAPIF